MQYPPNGLQFVDHRLALILQPLLLQKQTKMPLLAVNIFLVIRAGDSFDGEVIERMASQ